MLPPSETALLAQVLAHPDDLAPRLVIADWWIERGDPRGEWVVAQCEHARTDLDRATRRRIEARVAELFEAHEAAWLAPLGIAADDVVWCRGFIEHVRLAAEHLAACHAQLFASHPVSSLELRTTNSTELGAVVDLLPPGRLVKLGLHELGGLTALTGSPVLAALRDLKLFKSPFEAATLRELVAASPALRTLTVFGGNAGAIEPAIATQPWSELMLWGCGVTADGIGAMLRAPVLDTLESLRLVRNDLGTDGVRAVATAPFVRLTDLRLSHVGRGCAAELVTALPDLRRLDLRNNNLGATELRVLAARAPGVEHLKLSHNRIGDAGALALAAGALLGSVTELELEDAGLGVAGITAVLRSASSRQVTTLKLGGQALGPDLRKLLREPALTRLRVLDLSDCAIDDEAAALLAASPAVAGLEELNLSRNPLTEPGARALAASPHLANLGQVALYLCEVGDGAAALRERFGAGAWI
jgi:uncharacterized protein (TIGR02996 family)